MIEINDNPNIDAGVEDAVLKDDLYRRLLGDLVPDRGPAQVAELPDAPTMVLAVFSLVGLEAPILEDAPGLARGSRRRCPLEICGVEGGGISRESTAGKQALPTALVRSFRTCAVAVGSFELDPEPR